MKGIRLLLVLGLIGVLSVGTFFSCSKGTDEENLPVEEVAPLPEEKVLPEGESASAPEELGAPENETQGDE